MCFNIFRIDNNEIMINGDVIAKNHNGCIFFIVNEQRVRSSLAAKVLQSTITDITYIRDNDVSHIELVKGCYVLTIGADKNLTYTFKANHTEKLKNDD